MKNTYSKAYEQNDTLNAILKQAGDNAIAYYPGAIKYNLSMPGKLIETNAIEINGDTLSWKINSDRFLFNDYTINAVSRKPNYWAFAITGFIVVLGILGLFQPVIK